MSKARARLLQLNGDTELKALLLEVWLERFQRNGHGKRPYRNCPVLVVPEPLKAAYRAAMSRRNRYAMEEMGFIVRDLVRIMEAGGGRRELVEYLKRESVA